MKTQLHLQTDIKLQLLFLNLVKFSKNVLFGLFYETIYTHFNSFVNFLSCFPFYIILSRLRKFSVF